MVNTSITDAKVGFFIWHHSRKSLGMEREEKVVSEIEVKVFKGQPNKNKNKLKERRKYDIRY